MGGVWGLIYPTRFDKDVGLAKRSRDSYNSPWSIREFIESFPKIKKVGMTVASFIQLSWGFFKEAASLMQLSMVPNEVLMN